MIVKNSKLFNILVVLMLLSLLFLTTACNNKNVKNGDKGYVFLEIKQPPAQPQTGLVSVEVLPNPENNQEKGDN